MNTSRRGFLKLMTATIATPVIAKLSIASQLDEGLVLPDKIEAVQVIEPKIIQSGAASYARANRIYCMPGMVGQLSDHIKAAAMGALPGGTHFQVRAVPMTGADLGRARVRRGPAGVALMWITESDVTPTDGEYELVGSFMVPKREEVVLVPAHPNSVAARVARGESIDDIATQLSTPPEPQKRSVLDWLLKGGPWRAKA